MCDETLIKIVRKKPLLFDKSRKDHYNLAVKGDLWEKIAIAMDSQETAFECYKRWTALRNRYAAEMRKRNRLSDKATFVSEWPLFDTMNALLHKHYVPRVKPKIIKVNIKEESTKNVHETFYGYDKDTLSKRSVGNNSPIRNKRRLTSNDELDEENIDNYLHNYQKRSNKRMAIHDMLSSLSSEYLDVAVEKIEPILVKTCRLQYAGLPPGSSDI